MPSSQGKIQSATSHVELKQDAHNQLCHIHYVTRNNKWHLC